MLIAFDLLAVDGEDIRRLPLHERRDRLRRLVARVPGVGFSEALEQGEALFHLVCTAGLEGIVSKRIDSPYRCGPATMWVKVKNPDYIRT